MGVQRWPKLFKIVGIKTMVEPHASSNQIKVKADVSDLIEERKHGSWL